MQYLSKTILFCYGLGLLLIGCSIDKENPKLALTSYSPNRNPLTLTPGETFSFTLRFTDNKALERYEVTLNQISGVSLLSKSENLSGKEAERTFNIPITEQTIPGTYQLKAVVFDAERLGIVSAPSNNIWLTIEVNSDIKGPTITITQPESSANVPLAGFAVKGTVEDELSNLKSPIEYRLLRADNLSEVWRDTDIAGSGRTFNFDKTIKPSLMYEYGPGNYIIEIRAQDIKNNVSKQTIPITIVE